MSENNEPEDYIEQAELMEKIIKSPDCTIYGTSKYSQTNIVWSRRLTVIMAGLSVVIILAFDQTWLAGFAIIGVIILAIVIFSALSYLNWAHNYFKIFVSSLGIANETKWVTGAMTWNQVEIIEVKFKRGKIDYILLRQGLEKLGTRSSFLAHRLKLDVVSEFVGGIENWHLFNDMNDITKADEFYVKPDRDRSEAKKQLEDLLLFEWIGEQDFDADKTKKQTSSKNDEEIYRQILNDPKCVCLKDSGSFSRTLGSCKLTLIMLVSALFLMFYGMFGGPFSIEAFIITIILFILMFYGMCKGDEKLVMSPIGVARFIHGGPEAIEWQHVEYIDFEFEEDLLVQVEFFGNKRRVFCPRFTYRGKFSMELIQEYIPDIDTWEKMTRPHWGESAFRLLRPEV